MQVLFLMAALLLTATGCTTIKTVELDKGQSYAEQIEVGDKVRLILHDGRVRELRALEVNERHLSGKHRSGHIETVYWSDVFSVQTISLSPAKTVGNTTTGILVAGSLLVIGALVSGSCCAPGLTGMH